MSESENKVGMLEVTLDEQGYAMARDKLNEHVGRLAMIVAAFGPLDAVKLMLEKVKGWPREALESVATVALVELTVDALEGVAINTEAETQDQTEGAGDE